MKYGMGVLCDHKQVVSVWHGPHIALPTSRCVPGGARVLLCPQTNILVLAIEKTFAASAILGAENVGTHCTATWTVSQYRKALCTCNHASNDGNSGRNLGTTCMPAHIQTPQHRFSRFSQISRVSRELVVLVVLVAN